MNKFKPIHKMTDRELENFIKFSIFSIRRIVAIQELEARREKRAGKVSGILQY
jgi:hypothetical protein